MTEEVNGGGRGNPPTPRRVEWRTTGQGVDHVENHPGDGTENEITGFPDCAWCSEKKGWRSNGPPFGRNMVLHLLLPRAHPTVGYFRVNIVFRWVSIYVFLKIFTRLCSRKKSKTARSNFIVVFLFLGNHGSGPWFALGTSRPRGGEPRVRGLTTLKIVTAGGTENEITGFMDYAVKPLLLPLINIQREIPCEYPERIS